MNEKYEDPLIFQERFLPAKRIGDKEYTLVLDLDETLIHSPEDPIDEFDRNTYNIRPGIHQFLRTMAKYFEIVIFTAGTQDYADYILDQVDIANTISHRLYRDHTSPTDGAYVKDLSKLGRELSKTIIVDNLAENFELQERNGIEINNWYDDLEDTTLSDLGLLLEEIITKKPEDVRDMLDKYRDTFRKFIETGTPLPRASIVL